MNQNTSTIFSEEFAAQIHQINAQSRQVLHDCLLQDLERCRSLLGCTDPDYGLVADALERALGDAIALAGRGAA